MPQKPKLAPIAPPDDDLGFVADEDLGFVADDLGFQAADSSPLALQPPTSWMDQVIPGISSNIGLTPRHITRALSTFGQSLAALPGQAWEAGKDPANLIFPGAGVARQTIINPAIDRAKKAVGLAQEGRNSEAVGNAIAAVTPGVGPFTAGLTEKATSGQLPEAIGELGAAYATGKLIGAVPKAPTLANRGYQNTMGAAGDVIAKTSEKVGGAVNKISDPLLKPIVEAPETTFIRAMKVTEPEFLDRAPAIMNELKTAERSAGKPFQTVKEMSDAADVQSKAYSKIVDEIINPQANRIIQGSRKALYDATVKDIPDDIRLNDNKQYVRLVKNADQILKGPDYTLGELNNLRKDLNATNSPFYGKDVSGQIVMEQGKRAMDLAKGRTVRGLLTDALARNGLGHEAIFKDINGRIGSLISFRDAARPLIVPSALEAGSSRAGRIMSGVGKLATPFESTKKYLGGESMKLNRGIMDALRRWEGTPKPVGPIWPQGPPAAPVAPPVNPLNTMTVHGTANPRPNQSVYPTLTPRNPMDLTVHGTAQPRPNQPFSLEPPLGSPAPGPYDPGYQPTGTIAPRGIGPVTQFPVTDPYGQGYQPTGPIAPPSIAPVQNLPGQPPPLVGTHSKGAPVPKTRILIDPITGQPVVVVDTAPPPLVKGHSKGAPIPKSKAVAPPMIDPITGKVIPRY